MTTLKKGDVVQVRSGSLRAKAFIVRQSLKTGTLTVELLESRGAYTLGTQVHVKPYECKPSGEVHRA